MRTSRLEAFSDGVFAIAITLLVLDLKVPNRDTLTGGLGSALWAQWPSYAAYLVSFFVIGVIWINHHTVLDAIGRADKTVLVLNLGLLLMIVTVPFTTSLFAEYLREGNSAKLAAAIYSAVMVVQSIFWWALWRHAAYHSELLAGGIDPARARESVRGFAVGTPVYGLAVALSFVNPYLVLGMHLIVAALYLHGRLNLGESVGA